jgi:hypothetical protein
MPVPVRWRRPERSSLSRLDATPVTARGFRHPQIESALMSRRSNLPAAPFTAPERDLLRRELCRHFGEDPAVANGIFLRTWRGGERRGQPKIPPAVQTMLDRSLLELRISQRGPRVFFTEAGLTALRQLVLDGRAMDPARFAHLRVELGIDPESLAAE